MPTYLEVLNDLLSRVTDRDAPLIVVSVWVPPTEPIAFPNSVLVSTNDLLTRLDPKPLPDQPPEPEPEPEPPPPPPPAPEFVEMGVASRIGLSIRADKLVTATKIGSVNFNDVLTVTGEWIGGDYRWTQLVRVNGLKYPLLGYVAIGRVDGSETYLVPKA